MKGRVIINGFLVDSEVPSEERLSMRVDLSRMPGYKHVDWVSELQDLLRGIDQDYRGHLLPAEAWELGWEGED